eukprot:371943-Amphidinium_carterae.1
MSGRHEQQRARVFSCLTHWYARTRGQSVSHHRGSRHGTTARVEEPPSACAFHTSKSTVLMLKVHKDQHASNSDEANIFR